MADAIMATLSDWGIRNSINVLTLHLVTQVEQVVSIIRIETICGPPQLLLTVLQCYFPPLMLLGWLNF